MCVGRVQRRFQELKKKGGIKFPLGEEKLF